MAPGTKVVQRLASLFVRDDAIKEDVMLKFFLDITGTDYLHFGMWEPGDPLELEYLQAAQERYAEHLLSLIPKGVRSILDVGCGVGGNARKMAERGYQVTRSLPIPTSAGCFSSGPAARSPSSSPALRTTNRRGTFDLILMSESVQYQRLHLSFANAYRALRPGGYLLTSDFYKLDSAREIQVKLPSHFLRDVVETARAQGFLLVHEEDITERTAPTWSTARGSPSATSGPCCASNFRRSGCTCPSPTSWSASSCAFPSKANPSRRSCAPT